MLETKTKKVHRGFTLIELLVVIAILALLASIILVSVGSTRRKGRDAKRKADLKQMVTASEIRYANLGSYPPSAGWFSNPGHGGLDDNFASYVSQIPDDPGGWSGAVPYMYWRKDYVGYGCLTNVSATKYGYYAKLENPTTDDTATISDSFDQCVHSTWGMNYKAGPP